MSEHAPLAPSSASRWAGQCAASVQMEATATKHPNETHEQLAAEGDAAHWVGFQMLHGLSVIEGAKAPNGVVIDGEMIEAAGVYADDVKSNSVGATFLVHEQRIDIPRVHRDNWGTPDTWGLIPIGAMVRVLLWDFKYGHRHVEAFENWQLLDYAAGILDHPAVTGAGYTPGDMTFQVRVVQPRNYQAKGPVRSWSVSGATLLGYIEKLRYAAAEAKGDFARAEVGSECGDCKARHSCKVLQEAAYIAMDVSHGTANLNLPPHALGLELRYLHRAQELLQARIDGLEQQALSLIKGGHSVSGWAVGQTPGREKWNVAAPEVFAAADLLGVDVRKAPEPITPNQARQKGLDESILKAFAHRPGGAIKLVPADNTLARKVFAKDG